MSQSTRIVLKTVFSTIEHFTSGTELAELFKLVLDEHDDQKSILLHASSDYGYIRTRVQQYADAHPDDITMAFISQLMQKEMMQHLKDCDMALGHCVAMPRTTMTAEITLSR